MKVTYIYSGSRARFRGVPGRDFPDTQFYGLNHLSNLGFEVESKDRYDAMPKWLRGTFLQKLFGFRLQHLLMFFATRNADLVVGASILYMMIWKKIFRVKTKYVCLDMSLERMLLSNRAKSKWRYAFVCSLMYELDAVVCLSSSQKDWLQKEFPRMKGKLYFVPLGVDANFYRPVYERQGDYVLSTGLDIGRDYKTLVAAARLLPNREFRIVCKKSNLDGIGVLPMNVKVYLDLPSSELHKMYKTARVTAIITHDDTNERGYICSGQTSMLDAMACGLPLIITGQACLNDYIRDGVEARFVEPYDVSGLTLAIDSFWSKSPIEMVKKARARAEEFTTMKMAAGLAEVFREVLER